MSTTMQTMIGPAAPAPSSATSKGTPMKPVFGKVATKAPKDASFQRIREFKLRAMAKATITSAQASQVKNTPALSNCTSGVVDPNRYSMHGSAKNSTNPFKPAID